jgi:hypothetical protein
VVKGRTQSDAGAGKRSDASELIKALFKFLPFEGWQVKNVEFLDGDTDTKVPHPFNTTDVWYLPIRIKGGAALIYDQHQKVDSASPTPPLWTNDYIVLRSSTAPVTVTLLLFTLRHGGARDRL